MLKRLNYCGVLQIAFLMAAIPSFASSEIAFPNGSNVVNVVTDRGVKNDGTTDVTDKLNNILTSDKNAVKIYYFPKGTYLVTGQVRGFHNTSRSASAAIHGPWIVGESRTETVIKLKDGVWPQDTMAFGHMGDYPKRNDEQVVLHTGDCGNTTFERQLRNMTINIGKNNAGATGVVFIASNSGYMADVDIVSEDGQGSIGLSLSGMENGPAYVRNVRVDGFKRGIWTHSSCMITMSQMVVENASEWGLVTNHIVNVDSIAITMKPGAPAVMNLKLGALVLLNGWFNGQAADTAAVYNYGRIFARNLHSTGYRRVLRGKEWGGSVFKAPESNYLAEFKSRKSMGLFHDPGVGLNLPVKYPPPFEWETNMSKWTNPKKYKNSSTSWTQAFKKALNETGKTSIVIPYGAKYQLADNLTVGNDFSLVASTGGALKGGKSLIIGDGSAPVVRVEGIRGKGTTVVVSTDRTVVLEGIYCDVIANGTGDLFVNDIMGSLTVKNSKQKVWVRKFNKEYTGGLRINKGTAWVLGYKSERYNLKAQVLSGAVLELFNFINLNVGAQEGPSPNVPAFDIVNGDFSCALMTQVAHNSPNFDVIVQEKRGTRVKKLYPSDNPDNNHFALYTGFNPSNYNIVETTRKESLRSSHLQDRLRITSTAGSTIEVSVGVRSQSRVSVELLDARGRIVYVSNESIVLPKGTHRIALETGHLAPGAYRMRVQTNSQTLTRPVVLTSSL